MEPDDGVDIDTNQVAMLRELLGGSFYPGPVAWSARALALANLLTLPNGRGGPALQICPSEDTAVLRKALGGRWHYAVTRNGTVIRDLPAKPNHPFEDAGDAVAYFASGIAPSRAAVEKKPPPRAPLKYGRILGAFDYELGPGGVNGR